MKPVQKLHSKYILNFSWQLLWIGIGTLFFVIILANRSPNLLRPLSTALRTGFGLIIPLVTIVVYFVFRISGKLGKLLAISVVLGIFALPLAGLWASGQTQTTVLAGIIPMYDAESYYIDTLGILNGTKFSLFSARRPLFPGLLTVLLSITNQNLMFSLAILTWITGLACFLTAKEIQRTHGAEVAVFVLMILFLFYRAHSGISMSEHLGVTLGSLGFCILWQGGHQKNLVKICVGLFVTTIALNARAGAFFVLPILILWAGLLFWPKRREALKAVLLATGAIALGFLLNLILTRTIAIPSGVPFANFSYTLYGLSSGGKSWAYIFDAHPEVLELAASEQPGRIYELAFEQMRQNPLLTVQGALFNWKMLFSDSYYNIYAYVSGENWKVNLLSHWVLYILCIIGVYELVRNYKNPISSLMIALVLGIFVSVPFLPPTDAYRMRPYAASIVVLAALPAFGLYYILQKTKVDWFINQKRENTSSESASIIFSLALITITILGPIILLSTKKPLSFQPVACTTSDSQIAIVRFNEGNYVNIKKQGLAFLDWMPNYHIGLFKASVHGLADQRIIGWGESLEPPFILFKTLNFVNNQVVFVHIHDQEMPTPNTYLQLCGTYETDPSLAKILNVNEVIPLSPE